MKISRELTDDAVLAELGERLAHRRIQQGLTQATLSRQAGVSRSTVDRLERGHPEPLVERRQHQRPRGAGGRPG